MMSNITLSELEVLRRSLNPLIGVQFDNLRLPKTILIGFEPSQIGTIVGTLMDACIPMLGEIMPDRRKLADLGITKHEGILKDREGYPDFMHSSGKRLELKLLYVDPVDITMKRVETPREPSARLTQKVTRKNVDPRRDVLFVVAYQLKPVIKEPHLVSPTIISLGCFSMIECINARDQRLEAARGKWFGEYETPAVLSKIGKAKMSKSLPVDDSIYGRKESEGKDYNEDTNFGKLKRIPYKPLQEFLKSVGANYGWSR